MHDLAADRPPVAARDDDLVNLVERTAQRPRERTIALEKDDEVIARDQGRDGKHVSVITGGVALSMHEEGGLWCIVRPLAEVGTIDPAMWQAYPSVFPTRSRRPG